MLSVVERVELLDEADAAADARDYARLDFLLRTVDADTMLTEPLLHYYKILAALQLGRIADALTLSTSAADYFGRDQDSRVYRRYLNVRGILLTHTGQLAAALDCFTRTLSLAFLKGDQQTIADATMNIGVVADIQGEWTDALAAQFRALSSYSALADWAMAAGCHHNLGMTFRQLGLLEESRSQFDSALELYQRHGTRSEIVATALEKAILYISMDELELAEAISREIYSEVRSMGNVRLIGEAQRVLGLVYVRLSRPGRALRYLESAYDNSVKTGNLLLQAECAEELAGIFGQRRDDGNERRMRRVAYETYSQIGAKWRAERAARPLAGQIPAVDGPSGTK